jgi:DNA repair protein RecN (Recombination protein N)
LLCITHLPTVAAFADAHFIVEKASADQDTVSRVRRLARDEIIAELAAMAGADSPSARRVARDLLDRAADWKAAAARAGARSA